MSSIIQERSGLYSIIHFHQLKERFFPRSLMTLFHPLPPKNLYSTINGLKAMTIQSIPILAILVAANAISGIISNNQTIPFNKNKITSASVDLPLTVTLRLVKFSKDP